MSNFLVYDTVKFLRELTIKRVFLLFCCAVLAVSIVPSTSVMAFWPFGEGKKQPSVLPAQKVDITDSQHQAEKTTGGDDLHKKVDRTRVKELISERTAYSSTFENRDGTKTVEHSAVQQNYKVGDKWEKIDNSVRKVSDPSFQDKKFDISTGSTPINDQPEKVEGKAGSFSVLMNPLDKGIDLKIGDKSLNLTPVGANSVLPSTKDVNTVVYKDAWSGVDLEYELRGESVKETIVIKEKVANSTFDFKVNGGKVIPHATIEDLLTIEGLSDKVHFSNLSVDVFGQGIISEQRATQSITAGGIKIALDNAWLQSLSENDFPVRIDPTLNGAPVPANYYTMYKSDGYSCGSSVCYANTGSLLNGSWKHWRTYFKFPYYGLDNKRVLYANMHGYYKTGQGGTGVGYPRYMGHANCWGFNCLGTYVGEQQGVGGDFDINFTWRLAEQVNAKNFEAVWSLWGNECGCLTYKPYWDLRATVTYDTPTPIATPAEPTNDGVVVSTQPTLKVNPVTDADGDAVQYYFRVATGSNGESGAVINSGWMTGTPQWTVPEGILQDGTTYYWRVYTYGGSETIPNWVSSFKVDLRTGKDATQSYDTVGPVGVDLATGNATTSTDSHTMGALGGNIGISLSYDSATKSKKGLNAEYWNVGTSYNFSNGAPTSPPLVTRTDQNVNFDWALSNPSPGVIDNDGFYGRWKGYFVAPVAGSYTFGGASDDALDVYIDNQKVYGRTCCSAAVDYTGSTPVSLQAGQVVPIRVEYLEANWSALAKIFVKGAVAEQVVPNDWLRTEVKATPSQFGLTGRYYTNDGTNTFPNDDSDSMRFIMSRTDSVINFNWGEGAPAPGLNTPSFLTKWTGYITVPQDGSYTIGKMSDDGVRIKINNATSPQLDSWNYTAGEVWGSAVTLSKDVPTPITIEYFDAGGPASMQLRIKGPGLNAAGEIIPFQWLTPKAAILPDAWRLGVDVDGNVAYERLRVVGQNVLLEDSTRATHEYKWTGDSYKPPLNEDGQLTRNTDNTFTLLDSDGRTYVFDAEGKLRSVTAPSDDRNPAGLQYEYGGDPSRLLKIYDGVTNSRFGSLHYKNINENGKCSTPSGFTDAPNGMLCAFETTDGGLTKFYYSSGQLSRMEKPGGELLDFGYDSFGRITQLRDSMANDAIVANVRPDDNTIKTELAYDSIGRISSITAPAPAVGISRVSHTFEYLPSATQMHITGASEPHGFSKRIEYDNLLRTTKEVNVANLASTTVWHPEKDLEFSKTDPAGLMSTTIYDDDDRPYESYGPAPQAWFGSDRKPSTQTYIDKTPKTSTVYDGGFTGPAVSWYNVKGSSHFDKPKLLTHGFDPSDKSHMGRSFVTTPIEFTPDSGMDGYGFSATGKIRFPSAGTYTLRLYHDDGARIFINDQKVFNEWVHRSQGTAQRLSTGTFTAEAGKVYRFKFDYLHANDSTNSHGGLELWWSGPGITDNGGPAGHGTSRPSFVTPGFSLKTSETAHDSNLGNVTSTITYNKPEYGLVDKTTLDPSGLNLQTDATYETPGTAGTFLRQTSKVSAGGGTTTYLHYGATETRDNPCISGDNQVHQGGKSKGTNEADPDGAGTQTARTNETIYDASGDIVATRNNSDDWTCLTYDSRGRLTQTVIPALGNKPGRTISHNYAVNGNPLITSVTDDKGTITTEIDLLGRVVSYTDVHNKVTITTYDSLGRLTGRSGPLGDEVFVYDNTDRLIEQKLDNTTVAVPHYDQFGRLDSVDYPTAGQQKLTNITRDELGRTVGYSYLLGDNSTASDSVTRSQSGMIITGTRTVGSNTLASTFDYDKSGRLTEATIGSNSYSYEFGVADSSCGTGQNINLNAGKNSNRTKQTINGIVTTYCYDYADRLVNSSDTTITDAIYDSHGNTTQLGSGSTVTEFEYDSSDRSSKVTHGTLNVSYERDALNRITKRTYDDGSSVKVARYSFSTSNDSADTLIDSNGNVIEKYLPLPGGALLTIRPNEPIPADQATWSLPNIHGDVFVTTDKDGVKTGNFDYDPFGNELQVARPDNTQDNSFGWVGRARKHTETIGINFVQMGERVYIPALGRFLQVDPVEGGTLNNYVYAVDPVNQYDLSGKGVWFPIIAAVAIALARAAMPASKKATTKSGSSTIKQGGSTVTKNVPRSNPPKPAPPKPTQVKSNAARPMVGSRRAPLVTDRTKVNSLGNVDSVINGRVYKGHALNHMQNEGIYPSMVEHVIKFGVRQPSSSATTYRNYDMINDMTVVFDRVSGRVVTVMWGGGK